MPSAIVPYPITGNEIVSTTITTFHGFHTADTTTVHAGNDATGAVIATGVAAEELFFSRGIRCSEGLYIVGDDATVFIS